MGTGGSGCRRMNNFRLLLAISCGLQLILLLTVVLPVDREMKNLILPGIPGLLSLAIQVFCLSRKQLFAAPSDVPIKKLGSSLDGSDHLTVAMTNTFTSSSKLARRYLDSMPVGLFSTNENGVVLSANRRALMFMGTSIDKLVGAHLHQFFRLPDNGEVETFQSLLDQCSGKLVEVRLIRLDGASTEVPVEVSLAEFEGPAGRGYIMNVVDISDRHEVERLKQEFLSIVSHDLRSPLTTIQIFLESVSTEVAALPEQFRKGAMNSAREVKRLIRMVSSLLDIAKIRAGKFELRTAPFDLQPLLDRLMRNMSPIAAQGEIDLRFIPSDDFVVADEDRIYQVLENLIGNAIKFAPPDSSVVVEISSLEHCTRFEVRDSGPGVPRDKQSLIFESFGQVSQEDSTVRGGSGLGLAICKLIVEQHGGSIGVDSEPGKGSCFWFTLPD
jgi:PAS domain S-box-containing protein